jgi:3-dehydrosphinganine reductase
MIFQLLCKKTFCRLRDFLVRRIIIIQTIFQLSGDIQLKTFNNKLALVTGGSSGIGLAVAKKLAGEGAHVWILARREQILQEALGEIKAAQVKSDQQFGTLQCDLSNRQQLESTLKHFQDETGPPDLLINAAGYAHPDTFLNIDPGVFYRQMEVNYFGAVNCIRAFLPAMIARNSGHIVNICSTAGFVSFYGLTAYSASKYALRGFTDALRSEMKFTGVDISICFPPDTDTPGLETENRIKPAITEEVSKLGKLAQPEAVAEAILKGIQKNQYVIISGSENKFFFFLINPLGKLVAPIVDVLVTSAAKKFGK